MLGLNLISIIIFINNLGIINPTTFVIKNFEHISNILKKYSGDIPVFFQSGKYILLQKEKDIMKIDPVMNLFKELNEIPNIIINYTYRNVN